MAYTPTTWAAGDKVTAEKLNNIEQGIVNASPLILSMITEDETTSLNKTWQEIFDAVVAGTDVKFLVADADADVAQLYPLMSVEYGELGYCVFTLNTTATETEMRDIWVASSANDYPVYWENK